MMKRFDLLFCALLAFLIFLPCCHSHETGQDDASEDAVVQDDAKTQAADVDTGKTYYPPAPGLPPAKDTIRIAVISDINGSYGSTYYSPNVHAAIRDIIRRKADIVLCAGDMVAGQKKGLNYKAMWQAFHYAVDDVFFDQGIDFVFAPGNHDASSYAGFEPERAAYAQAWESRKPRSPMIHGGSYPFWYGVLYRDILILTLDVTRPYALGDDQLDWLEASLRHYANARHKIVMGHLPIDPIRTAQFYDVVGSQRFLDILQAQKVDFYISGHHHVYYPGHIDELRTIAAPALGANPRAFSRANLPRNAYVWIELPPEGPAKVEAFVAPDYRDTVDIKQLPTRIFQTDREDLGMANYIMELMDRAE